MPFLPSIFKTERIKPFQETENRIRTMFKPIKSNEIVQYLATPAYDLFFSSLFSLGSTLLLIDTAIHFINAAVSLLNALRVSLLTVYETDDHSTVRDQYAQIVKDELKEAIQECMHGLSSFTAQFNFIFSIISLFSRPIFTLIEAYNKSENSNTTEYAV